ncbi:MAG TPA: DNA gyrase subunit B [Candidatus Ornithoclostridium faecigallinarum]|nr:DNA gyrase subunit B [Candidatus Ornithoclostridium faecigallinarum]
MAKEKLNVAIEDDYDANSLKVLEGLEAVRKRPGMYIGGTGSRGMHHILWEIIDNSIDEITNGHGSHIDITIYPDNSVSVKDDGRGIPVDINTQYGITGVEMVFTKLHAGGKFDNTEYKTSGGLHGVGASVANALSEWLTVKVYKKGVEYTQEFYSPEINGEIKSGIKKGEMTSAPCDKKACGTLVTFLPDSRVFNEEKFSFDTIARRCRELAYLNSNLHVSVTDLRSTNDSGEPLSVAYHFEGGLRDFVLGNVAEGGKTAIYPDPIYVERKTDDLEMMLAVIHTEDYAESVFSFVNNIPTTEGGTHEAGFKSGYTKAFNEYARSHNILKDKQANLLGEDYREGMTAVLAIKLREVQFEGQTKTKLGNPEVRPAVENALVDLLGDWLNKAKKETIDAIFTKAQQAAAVRLKTSNDKETMRRLNKMTSSALVGKLSNCTGRKPEFNELFIVEGDSAGGSAKQGRDRRFQAILPLKGKPLNAEKKRINQILDNEEMASIINALGAGLGRDFNVENLKYNKVIILADADQDGAHIRAILLTFFYRYMKELIMDGHVYIGMPPLYRISDRNGTRYAYDDAELKTMLESAARGYTLQRYKGLGEMNPEQLWETTMDPSKRTLMRVTIEDASEAESRIAVLMGDNVEARREYIYENANFNKVDGFKELKD